MYHGSQEAGVTVGGENPGGAMLFSFFIPLGYHPVGWCCPHSGSIFHTEFLLGKDTLRGAGYWSPRHFSIQETDHQNSLSPDTMERHKNAKHDPRVCKSRKKRQ